MTNNTRIFFDLDGTLTDPKLGITRCITHAIESLDIDALNEDDLTWCIGPPLLGSFEQLVGKKLAPVALSVYRERFADVGWAENIPYDGIHTALEELRNRDYELFVATSKPHIFAKKILHHFQLDQYFGHVYIYNVVNGWRSKIRYDWSSCQQNNSSWGELRLWNSSRIRKSWRIDHSTYTSGAN